MELRDYLNKAQKEKWAIGQFNFSSLEQLKGILAASQKLKKPVILGTSEGECRFLGLEEIVALVEISKMKYKVSAFLNLDHAKDLNLIKKAVDLGYSAIHFDGSDLPFEKNIKETKKAVDYAHKKGVLAEGELGRVKGESVFHKNKAVIEEKDLTSPEEVSEFIKKTNVDSLAVAISNIHGVYNSGKPKLDFERLKKISSCLPERVFLVLHGGSAIPEKDIKKAIQLDIVKININTELRITWKEALKKSLKNQEVKPYKILLQVQNSIQKKVEEKIKLFICE